MLGAGTCLICTKPRSSGNVGDELPERGDPTLGREHEPTEFLDGAADLNLEEHRPAPFLITLIAQHFLHHHFYRGTRGFHGLRTTPFTVTGAASRDQPAGHRARSM